MRRLLRLERAAALRREPYVLVISKGNGKVVRVELVPPGPPRRRAGGGVRWRGG